MPRVEGKSVYFAIQPPREQSAHLLFVLSWLVYVRLQLAYSSTGNLFDRPTTQYLDIFPGMRTIVFAGVLGLAAAAVIRRWDDCPTGAPACCIWHLVVPGDTCASVAEQAGIPLEQFYGQNPSINHNNCPNLRAGCSYCVRMCGLLGPCPSLTPGCTESRAVVSGDTCEKLINAPGDWNKINHFFDLNLGVERPGCTNLKIGCKYCLAIPPQPSCPGGHLSEPVRSEQTCCELIGDPCDGAKLNKFYDLNRSVLWGCPNLQIGQRAAPFRNPEVRPNVPNPRAVQTPARQLADRKHAYFGYYEHLTYLGAELPRKHTENVPSSEAHTLSNPPSAQVDHMEPELESII
ncbi:carbohydrate-binding module family 50 protein [Trematosphaeria pertusa]|uniref:Carbohydrate-binding module family 50 protein n=1 Tax=Trematosphaeria pertusa TaxID=390896 RepID=A0A6A6J2S0_9PLEO|nr:carbohydrate-binding module family 50 protein [Trematosphaeria pertusa]KAF2256926.1 carbohydrate-binding module family 50 protein [Trematosphaeria pertusa]